MSAVWAKRIGDYYRRGIYTGDEVKVLVPKFITQAECDNILATVTPERKK